MPEPDANDPNYDEEKVKKEVIAKDPFEPRLK